MLDGAAALDPGRTILIPEVQHQEQGYQL
jgi:hypothetical protein